MDKFTLLLQFSANKAKFMKDLHENVNSYQKEFDPRHINAKMRAEFIPNVKTIIVFTLNYARIASEQRKNLFKL